MSGTSTPLGNRSPPPPEGGQAGSMAAGPSALQIGKRFVKQYYQTLMSNPDQIHRYYQQSSVLSDGEGSTPTDPVTFESTYAGNPDKFKDRFFVKDFQIRFDMEHGAIDAQPSVNGGLLLVVTGHIVYVPSASEDEDAAVDEPIRKGFVHTFFLNAMTSGAKKSFYVHNDILRFHKETVEVTASIPDSTEVVTEPPPVAPVPEEPEPTPVEPIPETKPIVPETQQKLVTEPVETKTEETVVVPEPVPEEAPGGGVEETKEEPPAAPAPAPPAKQDKPSKKEKAAKKQEDKENRSKNKGKAAKDNSADGGRKSPVPPPSPAPKPPPGSWASLVAGAGGNVPAATSTSAKAAAPAATKQKAPSKSTAAPEKPAPAQPANEKKESGGNNNAKSGNNNANNSSNSHKMGNNATNNTRPPKRDPDCTLVIKNLPDNTKEADVTGLFEPFAAQNNGKIVGCTVAAHRGIAFVDFDSVTPVMKAVIQHQEEPIKLNGRVLEVDQKTAEQRARRAAQRGGGGGGGNYRSGSPSNNNSNNNGGANRYGGGRGGHRRRDGGGRGGGDRGGGGMGGRGGRGGR